MEIVSGNGWFVGAKSLLREAPGEPRNTPACLEYYVLLLT